MCTEFSFLWPLDSINAGLVVDLLTSLELVCTEFAQTKLANIFYCRKRDHAFSNLTVNFLIIDCLYANAVNKSIECNQIREMIHLH